MPSYLLLSVVWVPPIRMCSPIHQDVGFSPIKISAPLFESAAARASPPPVMLHLILITIWQSHLLPQALVCSSKPWRFKVSSYCHFNLSLALMHLSCMLFLYLGNSVLCMSGRPCPLNAAASLQALVQRYNFNTVRVKKNSKQKKKNFHDGNTKTMP